MMQEKKIKSEMIIGDTVREENGLAMSSRNMRLSATALQQASALHRALQFIKDNIRHQSLQELINDADKMLLSNSFDTIDYIAVCDAATLLPVNENALPEKSIVLAAAFIEGVRLIDNLTLT